MIWGEGLHCNKARTVERRTGEPRTALDRNTDCCERVRICIPFSRNKLQEGDEETRLTQVTGRQWMTRRRAILRCSADDIRPSKSRRQTNVFCMCRCTSKLSSSETLLSSPNFDGISINPDTSGQCAKFLRRHLSSDEFNALLQMVVQFNTNLRRSGPSCLTIGYVASIHQL
jgi:hypothetical protein